MIIWLNGPFGVGKTTLANRLHQEIPDSILYDPENLGDFFQENLPKAVCPEDFQDYLIWRQTTVQIIRDLATKTGKVIIVPMTVFKKEYYQEIIEQGLREDMYVQHYILVAEKETILDRLDKRTQENNNWALKHLDNCLQAFEDQIPGRKIDTGGLTVDEIAEIVLEVLK
ncbi:AAA family ATPase [Streptococcus sp.]|uniref:AAA family ATPase n=1 Tax=Streptococcus sp. TaxID=1306 RepID=UPI00391B0A2C